MHWPARCSCPGRSRRRWLDRRQTPSRGAEPSATGPQQAPAGPGLIEVRTREPVARMFNPPHPGLTLRDDVLPALGLSVTEAVQQLDVNRVTLSHVLNGHAAISPEMALRIEAWLGVERGGEARIWLIEQSAYDMWQAGEQRFKAKPMHVQPAPSLRVETS